MTVPSLRALLLQGFESLDPEDMDGVLNEPTLTAAVRTVIAHTHQHSTRIVATRAGQPGSEATRLAYGLAGLEGIDARRSHYADGDTIIADLLLTAADTDDWVRAAGGRANARPNRVGLRTFTNPRRPPASLVRERRATIVRGTLSTATVAVPTVEEIVTATFPDKSLIARYGTEALALWLDARMAQGYTEEAAQTMLALVADLSVLAYLPGREERHAA
jgi:hypothetical protein